LDGWFCSAYPNEGYYNESQEDKSTNHQALFLINPANEIKENTGG
jgi:hypothetical protein